jgi:hypothetical protein
MKSSHSNPLFLVINLFVQVVEVLDRLFFGEWLQRLFVLVGAKGTFALGDKFCPLLVELSSLSLTLLDLVLFFGFVVHLERLFEGKGVNFFHNSFQGNQRFLQDFVPVVVSQVNDDWNKHWESLLLVVLEDVQEVVILEEAHSSVSDLQVEASDADSDSLEKSWDQVVDLVDFAHFQYFLQFSEEQGFLDSVGEWPVFEETFQKWDGKSSVLG